MENMMIEAKHLQGELIDIRRTLHQNPEVGRNLPKTKAFVMEKLKAYGYEPQEIGGGIVAMIQGSQEGKTILLRADMDALAIQEETSLPFASNNGAMHACGHDMHTTMLLGAAKLLKQHQEDIHGCIKLVFQPDEEGFTGAKEMLKAGILENPHVDAGMALHVHSGTPSNMILCGRGTYMSGCTLFSIRVKGTGCHGAMPEAGIDPINIAAHIYLSLQTLNAREISPLDPIVVTIGKFVAGKAPNIIPEEVVLEGSIRTFDATLSQHILKRIEEISKQTAKLFKGEATVSEIASAPPLMNDIKLMEDVVRYMKEMIDPQRIVVFDQGGMGSEDFASYTQEIPCCYLVLGVGTKEEDPSYGQPMHNACVIFNEDILYQGSALMTWNALRFLQEHGL